MKINSGKNEGFISYKQLRLIKSCLLAELQNNSRNYTYDGLMELITTIKTVDEMLGDINYETSNTTTDQSN